MMLKDIEGVLGIKIPLQSESLDHIVKVALPEHILKKISEPSLMPAETDIGLMKRFFNVFKANNEAIKKNIRLAIIQAKPFF